MSATNTVAQPMEKPTASPIKTMEAEPTFAQGEGTVGQAMEKPTALPPQKMMNATQSQPGSDFTPIVAVVNKLNGTFNKLLSAIELRLKKNDVNSQLKKITELISLINDNLAAEEEEEATEGGGRSRMKRGKKTLRNLRMKKGKKTLRNRRA